MSVSRQQAASPFEPAAAFRRIIAHAAAYSPYYRDQPWAARLRAGFEVAFSDLPITGKDTVRDRTADFRCKVIPPEDGDVISKYTSGSTGIALHMLKTAKHFAVNRDENERLKSGWGFAQHRRHVQVSSPHSPEIEGRIEEILAENGSTVWNVYSFNSGIIGDLLRKTRATLLSARPSVALGVLQDNPDIDFLKLVSTVSERIPQSLPELIKRIPGCLHYDVFGAIETGVMAGLCKKCGRYHIANRHLLFELLDDEGQPVAPGEMGRVIVTPLFNLAMPLIRYDIGDYAMRAHREACDGTGLALKKIVGRRRDLFKLPNGTKTLPYPLGEDVVAAGIRQCKLVQTSLTEVEVRYVPIDPSAEADPLAVQRMLDHAVSPLLRAIPVKVTELPVRANAKFVLHESLI